LLKSTAHMCDSCCHLFCRGRRVCRCFLETEWRHCVHPRGHHRWWGAPHKIILH